MKPPARTAGEYGPRGAGTPEGAMRSIISLSFRFEITFHFDGGHAARTSGGDGLAVDTVLHVAGMKHTRDVGTSAALRDDVAFRIGFDLLFEDLGVGNVADGNEKTIHRLVPDVAGLQISQARARDQVLRNVVNLLD